MKRNLGISVLVVACVVLAATAYLWATGIMDSFYAYRSPLQSNPPAPGQPVGDPLTRRLVFVLIDALRLDTSMSQDVMPFLGDLRQRGAWATMRSRPPSYSAPSYSVLFTGAWPDVSDGPALNLDYDDMPSWTQDDLVSVVRRRGFETGIAAYYWFEKLIPQASVSAAYYTAGEDQAADRAVVDAALGWLKGGDYGFVFIHLDQVDFAGHHEGGPSDARWDAAARRADDLLREIASELDLTQDTLFICSDHGQIDQGGHGGPESVVLTEPFVLVGAGVRPGPYGDVNMVDVAPTLAALLGAGIPASSQGHVLADMLLISGERRAFVEGALRQQQAQLVEHYQAAIGQENPVEKGEDTVAAHQAALEAARTARLKRERVPRAALALVIALIPVALLIRWRRVAIAWLFAGAAVYALVFHVLYAVVGRRTYSLSSVASADDLIVFCAVTVLIATLLGWLVSGLGLRAFRRRPGEAAQFALRFGLLVSYLLLLMALWSYAINGALITWTLPEQGVLFLAFLSLIQVLFVGLLGIVLAAASALIAWLSARKPAKNAGPS